MRCLLDANSVHTPDRGNRILLVDDDAATSRIVKLWFEIEGLELETADTRESALAGLSDSKPDLMIMDYMMGGLDARTFLEQARLNGYSGPVLLCTGLDGDLGLAVDGVVRKPFDPETLVRTVRTLIEESA